jgi:mRNA-degrading endonuclease toxin of MazEF toxin-antitoxin module
MSSIHKGDVVLVGFYSAPERITIRRPAVIVAVDGIRDEVSLLPLSSKPIADDKVLLIPAASPEGKTAGLRLDTTIDCRFVAKMPASLVISHIGRFDNHVMQKIDRLLSD